MRARLEQYLNAKPATSVEEQTYQKIMRDILDTLSPHNTEREKLPKALAQLQIASGFPMDDRLCESLANTVYRAYLARVAQDRRKSAITNLEDQRRQLDWNYDMWKKNLETDERERKLSDDPKSKSKTNAVSMATEEAGHVSRYVTRIAETEVERAEAKATIKAEELLIKIEFQALVAQFFMQRRFEHVIIAARLYTEYFHDGDGRLELDDKAKMKVAVVQTIGFEPTISTLDSLAVEAIADVNQSIESFYYLIESGKLDGALRQLEQAFILGQFLPSVKSVPREPRDAILEYAQNSFKLVNAIEVKDYDMAEDLVTKLTTMASDFDNSKPSSAISTAKLSSDMRIRSAKNAALAGNDEAYAEHIQAAAEIWPKNPRLKEQFDLISDAADVQLQAKLEFDRLLGTQSYRQIFNDKARFIAATVDDKDRQEKLEQVLNSVQEIETVIKQADMLAKAGNRFAAWEVVEKTFKRYPDDVPLSAKRSDLATNVAPFVKALKTAEELEESKQYGSSLGWYLNARRIYPQSEYAKDGIGRLVDQILPEEATSLDKTSTSANTNEEVARTGE